MRWFHLAVIVLLAAITLVFAIQNLQIVTVSFLRISARTPLLITVIYLVGAVTGGSCSHYCGGLLRGPNGVVPLHPDS
jgi:uncharacterized integral membrane protein